MSAALSAFESVIGGIARGFSSAPVQLGSVVLQGVEVPSELALAGQQKLVVHKLPGGDRVINAVGADPAAIALSGMFTGPFTSSRYSALDAMRTAGTPVQLLAAGQSFLVVVSRFSYTIQQRGAVIPYTIDLEVIPQLASSLSSAGTASYAGLISPDTASALAAVSAGLTISEGDSSLLAASSALTGLSGVATTSTGYVAGLGAAASALSACLTSNGTNLVAIADAALNGICSSAASLAAAVAAAGAIAEAVQAGSYINRALSGTSATGSAIPTVVS